MKVELSRFKVKKGKSGRVTEWMSMINARRDEVQKIIPKERMKLEVIFRELIDGEEYLYWFSVQGDEGVETDTSDLPFTKDFSRFHDECIEHSYGMRDAQPQAVIVPPSVAAAMQWKDPEASIVEFEARELVQKPSSEWLRKLEERGG